MREEIVTIGAGGHYPLEGILTIPDAAPGEREDGTTTADAGMAAGAQVSASASAPQVGEPASAPQGGGAAAGTYPALLLVHGSGPLDRDETIGALKPFKDIAQYLAANGIASLRYDKRTFTYRKQIRKELKMPTVKEETIEDALLAAALLKGDARIDAARVFLAGHSLGGMLAPRIDAEGGDFAGIITMAGSPRRLVDIMVDQNEAVIESLKGPIKLIALRQVASFYKKLAEYDSWTLEESKEKKFLNICAYYFKEMEAHPARDYLLALTKPIMCLQGAKDFQVSVGRDFVGYQTLLLQKDNAIFNLYPNLSHAFTPSVYGDIKKYKKEYAIPAKVDGKVLEDIRDFILAG